jgi:hypothetical protein
MQAFAVVGNQICFAGLLVVPRFVGRAGFHRREDAHQTRLLASLRDDVFHPVFLAEVPFANELDFDPRLRRHLFGVFTNPVAERLGELRIVENPDLSLERERRHPTSETDPRQRAEDQHPVEAAQHAFNLFGVPLG